MVTFLNDCNKSKGHGSLIIFDHRRDGDLSRDGDSSKDGDHHRYDDQRPSKGW